MLQGQWSWQAISIGDTNEETSGQSSSSCDTEIESTVRYFGDEVDDALAIAEQIEV